MRKRLDAQNGAFLFAYSSLATVYNKLKTWK